MILQYQNAYRKKLLSVQSYKLSQNYLDISMLIYYLCVYENESDGRQKTQSCDAHRAA